MVVARSFYLKCFLLAELRGGGAGPEFTSVNTALCDEQNRNLDRLHAVFIALCSQILTAPAEFLASVSTNKNSPYFHFIL